MNKVHDNVVRRMTDKMQHLEIEAISLRSENEDLKEKLLLLEYHQCRNNLVFYGIDESDGPESGRDCYDKIMHYVSSIPDINPAGIRIDCCHRLGAKVRNKC